MIPDYERDPAAIYRKSFETIREEAALDGFNAEEKDVAIRLIHACGMIDLVKDMRFAGAPVSAARNALATGCTIFCDVEMVAAGIIDKRLPPDCDIRVTLNDSRTPDHARHLKDTIGGSGGFLGRSARRGDCRDRQCADRPVPSVGNHS